MTKPLKVIAGTPDHPLIIGNIEIPCYVLEDETRVLAQRGMVSGLGMARGSASRDSGDRLVNFIAGKAISPFISNDLKAVITDPIRFRPPTGGVAYGYPATLLVDLCSVVLAARDEGVLQKQQIHIAERAYVLIRGFATVGIIALVDEATGYQEIRAQRALATILEKFIAEELQPWTRTFPYEFYQLIYRLRGWDGPEGHKRTPQVGKDTNDLVYSRLAPGVLAELQKRNPTVSPGYRRNKHHQWFTPDLGHPKLKEHLAGVMALMRAAPNWGSFYRSLQRSYPKRNEQIPLTLGDDE